MYESVREIIRQHETVWTGVPKFVSAVAHFESELETLKNKAVGQNSVILGVSNNKSALFAELTGKIVAIQNALWVYANSSNNFELMARHKTSISDLKKMNNGAKLIHLEWIGKDLEEYAGALVEFGISAENVLEFTNLSENYRLASTQPRMAIIERKLLTKKLEEHSGNLDFILRFILDKLMVLFKIDAPDFVYSYMSARKVINYGTRHNSTSELPPTETDGEPF